MPNLSAIDRYDCCIERFGYFLIVLHFYYINKHIKDKYYTKVRKLEKNKE